jgi:hypothetical protein
MIQGDLVGESTEPAAKLFSSGVSIGLVLYLYLFTPKGLAAQFTIGWLMVHLGNHFYVGLKDMKIPVCADCGKKLINESYAEHTC